MESSLTLSSSVPAYRRGYARVRTLRLPGRFPLGGFDEGPGGPAGRRLEDVTEVNHQDREGGAELVLTFEELAEASRHAPPPTPDDVSVTWDGRAIDTKEKLLAVLKEVEANERAGVTYEQLHRRPEANWRRVDWDWDPATDPRG